MEGHVDKKQAMLYIYSILPPAKIEEVDSHILSCSSCMGYITYLLHKRMEACRKIRRLFGRAYRDKLTENDAKFWDAHMKYCDNCFNKYMEFVDKKEKGIVDILVGYISGLAEMLKPAATLGMPVLEAASKKDITKDIQTIKTLSGKGITIAFIKDKKGNTRAYLSSDKYSVEGVTVSILRKRNRHYETVTEAKANKRGVANLGKLKLADDTGETVPYAVKVLGALKK